MRCPHHDEPLIDTSEPHEGELLLDPLAWWCRSCLAEQERALGGRCAACDRRTPWPPPPQPAEPWPVRVGGRALCSSCAPPPPPQHVYVCDEHNTPLVNSLPLTLMGYGWCPTCHQDAERRAGARCAGCNRRRPGPLPPGLAPAWPALTLVTPDGVRHVHYCDSCHQAQTARAPHALAGALDLGPEDLASAAESEAPTPATLWSPPAAEARSPPFSLGLVDEDALLWPMYPAPLWGIEEVQSMLHEVSFDIQGSRYRMLVTQGGPKGGGQFLFAFPDLWLHYAVELSGPASSEWLKANGCPRREAGDIALCIDWWFSDKSPRQPDGQTP